MACGVGLHCCARRGTVLTRCQDEHASLNVPEVPRRKVAVKFLHGRVRQVVIAAGTLLRGCSFRRSRQLKVRKIVYVISVTTPRADSIVRCSKSLRRVPGSTPM